MEGDEAKVVYRLCVVCKKSAAARCNTCKGNVVSDDYSHCHVKCGRVCVVKGYRHLYCPSHWADSDAIPAERDDCPEEWQERTGPGGELSGCVPQVCVMGFLLILHNTQWQYE